MAKKRVNRWLVLAPVLLIAAIMGLLSLALIGFETGLLGFLLGFLMACVPVPIYLAFALWIDRFEPEPPWLLAVTFVWGAAIATFVSMIFNTANQMIFSAVAGAAVGQTLGAVLSAPFVEEVAKGLALLLLFWWKRDEFDNVTDGIVYATMVGLGFAMTENIQYYGRAVAEHGVGALGVFVLRGVMSPFAHPLFTSLTGIGLGMARESDRKGVKIAAPVIGLAAAMFLHFLWNLSASFGGMFFVAYALVMVPAFIALIVVMFLSLRREARIIRVHLEQIAGNGIMSSSDVAELCSVRGRVGSSFRALTSGGLKAWLARKKFHRLATEFAFHSWRQSRGVVTLDQELGGELLAAVRSARVEAGLPAIAEAPSAEVVRRFTLEAPIPNVTVPGSVRGSLVGKSGAVSGRSFDIGANGTILGRDPSFAQIIISDTRVSKRHAWVGYRDGEMVVIDRGSTNGTFVNGKKVKEARVTPGDVIMLSDAAAFEVRA